MTDLARDGLDGVHTALNEHYDLAVLDIMPPRHGTVCAENDFVSVAVENPGEPIPAEHWARRPASKFAYPHRRFIARDPML